MFGKKSPEIKIKMPQRMKKKMKRMKKKTKCQNFLEKNHQKSKGKIPQNLSNLKREFSQLIFRMKNKQISMQFQYLLKNNKIRIGIILIYQFLYQ